MINSFTIKGNLIGLNDYINAERSNKYKAAKIKKDETLHCQLSARELDVDLSKRYSISINWFDSTKRDPDNIFFAIKFIFDGIVQAGKLKNDSKKHIGPVLNWPQICEKGKDRIVVRLDLI